jgi:ubiquinone/menaquinone biosynthesis C-methylase UbiE
MQNWDIVAPVYHSSGASLNTGPFKSTLELVRAADIGPSDRVLDVACGTGAVSAMVAKQVGQSGRLIGIDFSFGALCIAKSSSNGNFVQMDVEYMGLHGKFDRILCQYALMFFPDSGKVLRSLKELLKPAGRLAIAVHGTAKGVPYFSTIMEPVLKAIPDIRPPHSPSVHRFGSPADLESELSQADFENILIEKMQFEYDAGTFEQYWTDYLSTTANSIRKRIEQNEDILKSIKSEALTRSLEFSASGKIIFPWEVLIATADP